MEAARLQINTCTRRSDKEMIGFRYVAQIGKYSSGALEAPRLQINTCTKRSDKEMIVRFQIGSSDWEI